jgi:hypothetical protein
MILHLALNLRHEIRFREMRSQFVDCREAGFNLGFSQGYANIHGFSKWLN